ncbi:CPBP family intramembrane glutamic endopeptidase [Symmachiella macrocystis]|nr:CPBP family intramembrane glutamic endopeptidase [Symmachiella macrocystis]
MHYRRASITDFTTLLFDDTELTDHFAELLTTMEQDSDRNSFLAMAALFEGGLVVVALALGWVFGVPPLESLDWDPWAVLWGLAGVVPLYAGFVIFDRYPVGPLRTIKETLNDLLGPIFARCSKADLAVVAILAGVGEEVLFRGLLLPLTGGGSFVVGLLISSLLFGLAHAVTTTYVILAALAGLFFGLQWHYTGNLMAPIISHAVYDYLAFVKIARDFRASTPEYPPQILDGDP